MKTFKMIPVVSDNFWSSANKVVGHKMKCTCNHRMSQMGFQCGGCKFWKDIINGNGSEKHGYRWLQLIKD